MLLQEPMQSMITHCLANYDYADAVFLAERIHAEAPCEETLFLLATAYFRSGRNQAVIHLLSNCQGLSGKCKLLLAQVYVDEGNLSEAEALLLPQDTPLDSITTVFQDSSPFAYKLLGKIANLTDRVQFASECYGLSLKLNPFLWEAFEQLSLTSKVVDEGVFQTNSVESFTPITGSAVATADPQIFSSTFTELKFSGTTPSSTATNPKPTDTSSILHQSNRPAKFRTLFTSTPMGGGHGGQSTGFTLLPLESSSDSLSFISPGEEPKTKKTQQQSNPANMSVRRSSRLFSNSSVSIKENTTAVSKILTPRPRTPASKSPNRKLKTPKTQNQKNTAGNLQLLKDGSQPLIKILRALAKCYGHLMRYECEDAIDAIHSLSPAQFSSPWVVGLLAQAHFEKGDYEDAVKQFAALHENYPHHLSALPFYSTALWHLQRETELSSLSSDLLQTARTHPATWITLGNTFSLHKEHETAIKFFKRAIQVDPGYAYSYTLLGHEYVATEEHEKAMRCFRNAARINPNHYNAWYGMGMIYYKQERYDRAEVYYRKALNVHPTNTVLLCHLGVVQQALGKTESSLATFGLALEANPRDPLCKFHRASVLFAVNRLDEALDELEELKQIVPKESLVYFLIAKVFSKKGDTHRALLHFSWATDLDPKGANNQIKESIEPVLSKAGGEVGVMEVDLPTIGEEQPSGSGVGIGLDVSALG